MTDVTSRLNDVRAGMQLSSSLSLMAAAQQCGQMAELKNGSNQDDGVTSWSNCPGEGLTDLDFEVYLGKKLLLSSNAPSPVESREAPPTSRFPGFSEPP